MATFDVTQETVQIPLTQGQFALVDLIDADLAEKKWFARYDQTTDDFYAARNTPDINKKQRKESLHRVILSRMLGYTLSCVELVDHVNRHSLDCRRENLRLATHAQNMQNRAPQANNNSGFKGVGWDKDKQRWRTRIKFGGKTYRLGDFKTAEQAARAYDKAARELHGAFAFQNFPDS